MKKILSLLIVLALLCSLSLAAYGAGTEELTAADALHALGLFNGTGTNADGTPAYELDRPLTRFEAITMMVRLLGKEDAALTGIWQTPFTDLVDWAAPYVGYAYAGGLTMGVSDTAFGGEDPVTAAQYLTFVLRALDYSSGTDFSWDTSWTLSDFLGITHGEYGEANDAAFLRGDAAKVSFRALDAPLKGGAWNLAQRLIAERAITVSDYERLFSLPAAQTEEFAPQPNALPVQIIVPEPANPSGPASPSEAADQPGTVNTPEPAVRPEQVYTPEAVYATLIARKADYPEGMPWTSRDKYTRKDVLGYTYFIGTGCAAFAMILSDAVFGDLPVRQYLAGEFTYDSVRAGDILRVEQDTHTVIVLEVRADGCVVAEGNYNESIHWGRFIPKSEVEQADYIWTRYPD